MGTPVMIYGESGTGKSTSMRNFKKGELSIINVSKKLLPFKNDLPQLKSDDYEQIKKALKGSQSKSIVIDDATYLMTNEYMRTAKVSGFQKFTDMALHFFNLIQFIINELPEDKIVYVIGHVERDQNGNETFKTIGKLLDEKICLPGLFTIVLKSLVDNKKYLFQTNTNGQDTTKSPYGMFEQMYIENDLKIVDNTIRAFYNIG